MDNYKVNMVLDGECKSVYFLTYPKALELFNALKNAYISCAIMLDSNIVRSFSMSARKTR